MKMFLIYIMETCEAIWNESKEYIKYLKSFSKDYNGTFDFFSNFEWLEMC